MGVTGRRRRVVFVAGLRPRVDGATGGQVAAASAVFSGPLGERFRLVPLHSITVPPTPPLYRRAWDAGIRFGRFLVTIGSCDAALIFVADGWSVVEKGLMAVTARLLGRGVVVRFGSGFLPEQCARKGLVERWLRRSLRAADVVLVQGPAWKRFFATFDESRGKLLEAGNPVKMGREAAALPGVGRLVFVGWLERNKGVFEAVEVLKRILPDFPRATLTLAGDGSCRRALEAEVSSPGLEGRVRILGWTPHAEVLELLAGADAFIFPTQFEGMPNALLEAMAAGLPVISTPIGSIPDAITDGDSGILCPVGNVESMARAVRSVLSDRALASRIGGRAREVVAERYGVDRVSSVYASALEAALRARGRAT